MTIETKLKQTQNTKPVEILLVEDNQGDIDLTIRAFQKGKVNNNIHVTMDGVEALAFLRKEGEHLDAKTPDLILLDINLPKKNGFEVLMEIKKDERIRQIPVLMLTTSESKEDIEASYKNYANGFITKPLGMKEFMGLAQILENFWFQAVTLPEID